jgi:hypothetical protein
MHKNKQCKDCPIKTFHQLNWNLPFLLIELYAYVSQFTVLFNLLNPKNNGYFFLKYSLY